MRNIQEYVVDGVDTRNVMDHFKGMSHEDIKASLEAGRTNLSILIDNRTQNFNAGTIVRHSHCFLAKNIIFYGRREYNRRPCVGSYLLESIDVCPNLDSLKQFIADNNIQKIVGIDNNISRKTIYLHQYTWSSSNTLVCFGSEGEGLPSEILDICHDVVEVQIFGATRSLNVSGCASIVLYDHFIKSKGV